MHMCVCNVDIRKCAKGICYQNKFGFHKQQENYQETIIDFSMKTLLFTLKLTKQKISFHNNHQFNIAGDLTFNWPIKFK